MPFWRRRDRGDRDRQAQGAAVSRRRRSWCDRCRTCRRAAAPRARNPPPPRDRNRRREDRTAPSRGRRRRAGRAQCPPSDTRREAGVSASGKRILAARCGAENEQTVDAQALRREDVERRAGLALEFGGRGGRSERVDRRRDGGSGSAGDRARSSPANTTSVSPAASPLLGAKFRRGVEGAKSISTDTVIRILCWGKRPYYRAAAGTGQ